MTNWSELLDRDRLGLDPDVVSEVNASEGSDLDGDKFVEVWVVLNPRIGLDELRRMSLTPVQLAISKAITAQPDAGYPFIRFATAEDWESLLQGGGDDEEEAEDAAAT